ncbi:hypothetical protein AZ09_10390 [Acetobacter aceti 1023]|nr:hypothetical protein AZ09_10390 [Acetobacter aceti 1023]
MVRDFTLPEFAAFLTETALKVNDATHSALDDAARIVQVEAKHEVGQYQEAAGPFPAWAELADSTKEDRVRHGFTENDPGLRTGEMRESIKRSVGGHEAHVGSDDDKMVFFELGTEKQPPRTVLAGALIRKTDEVRHVIGRRFVGTLFGADVAGGSLPVVGGED